jgi:hypothetical protein
MSPQQAINQALDRLVRPVVPLGGRSLSAFQLCGYIGLAVSILFTAALVLATGLSLPVLVALILTGVCTFFALAFASKVVSGEEQLVYYHHEIAIVTAAALLLLLLRQPILPYLDVTILGIGAFLVCGRIGCLMVGCCHGRPSAWGVCYRADHAAAGFEHYYVGVRLLPVQAFESSWVLIVVLVGAWLMLSGGPAGSAFAWYVVAYDIGRFSLEFVRGDADRPYHRDFSEAQWISLGLTSLVAVAELLGLLPLQAWHVAAAPALVIWMGIVTLARRRRPVPTHRLLNPRHVGELAAALEGSPSVGDPACVPNAPVVAGESAAAALAAPPPAVLPTIHRTSLGIQLSVSETAGADGRVTHYALSGSDGSLSEPAARLLADLIVQLKHPAARVQFIAGQHAVYHLLAWA